MGKLNRTEHEGWDMGIAIGLANHKGVRSKVWARLSDDFTHKFQVLRVRKKSNDRE